jgi:hypothetical protein
MGSKTQADVKRLDFDIERLRARITADQQRRRRYRLVIAGLLLLLGATLFLIKP